METLFNALFIPYLFDWSRAQGNQPIKWPKIKDESQSECIRSLDSRPIRILTIRIVHTTRGRAWH